MKHKFLWMGILFLLITLFLHPSFEAKAQAPAPQLKALTVALWPEYDRPEVLVIYRGQLSSNTSLPAQITFRLPGYIKDVHAVAVRENGNLINVNSNEIIMQHTDDELWLTFPSTSPDFHFEYYDPVILSKENQTRQLGFDFSTLYDIETASFEVQQPLESEVFQLTPESMGVYTGGDNLQYSTIQVANMTADETFELSATYQRNTNAFSIQSSPGNTISQPEFETETSPPLNSNTFSFQWGYVLIGGGLVLLVGTAGYWWLTQRKTVNPNNRRQPRRKKRLPNKKPHKQKSTTVVSTPAKPTSSSFCYQCGTALHVDANFCHACGTQRRTD